MGDRIELPAHTLCVEHFQQCPVWRFLGPDESSDPDADESYVVAHTVGLGMGHYATYLVKATFTLKSGMHLPGFVELSVLGQELDFSPGLMFAGGKAVESLGKEAAVRLERILKTKDTQPFSWELDVSISGEGSRRKGAIEKPGFAQALALLVRLGRLRRMRRP